MAEQFIQQYPERRCELLDAMLGNVANRYWSLHDADKTSELLDSIITFDPDRAWQAFVDRYATSDKRERSNLIYWLGPEASFGSTPATGPLILFPRESVFEWISEDPENRAYAMARAMPKSMSQQGAGSWTREFLSRFGDRRDVSQGLMSHMYSDGWSGKASTHYRKKRETANRWLEAESSQRVRDWLAEYIDLISITIDREEIEEEREF